MLARLRHLFAWGDPRGLHDGDSVPPAVVTVIRLEMRTETARTRRLEPVEEEALLGAASPHLRALIAAGLSTGCRLGEFPGLQWRHIQKAEDGKPKWIVLDADRAKTNRRRTIPVGARLRAELEMRTNDPDGETFGPDAHVFGNEIGDLRQEFGSRLLESGADPHDVREFLGHANITTTSRYPASTPLRLERALARIESATEQKLPTQPSMPAERNHGGERVN